MALSNNECIPATYFFNKAQMMKVYSYIGRRVLCVWKDLYLFFSSRLQWRAEL